MELEANEAFPYRPYDVGDASLPTVDILFGSRGSAAGSTCRGWLLGLEVATRRRISSKVLPHVRQEKLPLGASITIDVFNP